MSCPYVCGTDKDGSVIISDRDNNRLQVMTEAGEFSLMPLPPYVFRPRSAAFFCRQLYVTSGYGNVITRIEYELLHLKNRLNWNPGRISFEPINRPLPNSQPMLGPNFSSTRYRKSRFSTTSKMIGYFLRRPSDSTATPGMLSRVSSRQTRGTSSRADSNFHSQTLSPNAAKVKK